jgi:hypothetical protein
MEISDGHSTPTKVSIDGVRIDDVGLLCVSLKAERQYRNRFEGKSSYEARKRHPTGLWISIHELRVLVDAFFDELLLSHRVLRDSNLWGKLYDARKQKNVPNKVPPPPVRPTKRARPRA